MILDCTTRGTGRHRPRPVDRGLLPSAWSPGSSQEEYAPDQSSSRRVMPGKRKPYPCCVWESPKAVARARSARAHEGTMTARASRFQGTDQQGSRVGLLPRAHGTRTSIWGAKAVATHNCLGLCPPRCMKWVATCGLGGLVVGVARDI